MNLSLPDKFYKLYILFGISLMIYGYNNYLSYKEKSESSLLKVRDEMQHVFELNFEKKISLNNLMRFSKTLAFQMNLKNPIVLVDSVPTYKDFKIATEFEKSFDSKIKNELEDYISESQKIDIAIYRLDLNVGNLKQDIDENQNNSINSLVLSFIGLIFITLGAYEWMLETSLEKKQNDKIYDRCQSCGKKFSVIRLYGTNLDRSLNYGLCRECYENGVFIALNFTQSEYKEYVEELIKNNIFWEKIRLRSFYLNLERWKE